MRLEKIKLAGFKSFVDPTTVHLPSNLVGVVGPNGCGKSNVIDAVRWVMGESSAKMLRGESMADVIFNGSTSRKPVGTASIELIFDNADGGAGGEYAKFNQISVKRQVSRDGQSSYFMNGMRCRRRDITGLFLGTGLGPRSYSIIEQGTISRLIEARPEDLRAFLEEAAGISKYKERRRETQNRITHTKENLDRLNDLRDEIAKQLQHLQRQAATAEKYKQYKERERLLQAELLALRWQALDHELGNRDRAISEQETRLEAAISRQRNLEVQIEHSRESHVEANENFNQVQGRYYAIGSDIARLEQTIQFARESRNQIEQDLHQTEQAWQESNDHRQQDESRLQELNTGLAHKEPDLEKAQLTEKAVSENLGEAEQAMLDWQMEWEGFNRKAAEPAQTAQVERTRINHIEQQAQNLTHRMERQNEELQRLNDPGLAEQIEQLDIRKQTVEAQIDEIQEQLSLKSDQITGLRDTNHQKSQSLDEAKARLQAAKGRFASLEALQEAALGKAGTAITEWLEKQGISQATRLAERIEVKKGWERAVETVLGHYLQAVCVDDLDSISGELTRVEEGALTLFDVSRGTAGTRNTQDNELRSYVHAPWSLDSLLDGILVVESLDEALNLRASLETGMSVITRDGIWLGSNWLRLNRQSEATSGILEREQEIKELDDEISILEELTEEVALAVQEGRERLLLVEQSKDELQQRLNGVNRELSDVRSALSGKQARQEHLRVRADNIRKEQEELKNQKEKDASELEETRRRLHAALEAMENLSSQRELLIQRRDSLKERLGEMREEATRQRREIHEMALRIESMRSSRESVSRNLERMLGQLSQLEERKEELTRGLEESQMPLIEHSESLELHLASRMDVEAELTAARQTLGKIDTTLRELEQNRVAAEQEVQKQRGSLDQLRMQQREVQVRCSTLVEQLNESGFQPQELFEQIPPEADVDNWQEEVTRMETRIRRLGPINLAAIEEFEEQSERMKYLDAQHADVTESLETLENAIRKIDRETRTRFKETFDRVNSGIQDKFPQLFGGGHAYLELTGEDLLETGVTVMARPPGKRNSSIHLLSGGEKALTAVAMVFAIFELNPAPFCMLDEVDAPLDDANVGRFCDMVKTMSNQVQFIFITHNKITMEIAHQLTGVTMHEPGVSRLVSVDVDEAAQMAAM
ncbi:MAG: chromosome segregation protein SMC [Gammaproteobacteria bacterium]|nr:chromosome segregation protein SMC [Gammaproteobacteria bacterium]